MNILFVTPYYTPLSFGGIESQVKNFSRFLSKSNKCSVIAPSIDKDCISFEGEVKVYRTKKVNPAFKNSAGEKDYDYFSDIIKKEKTDRIIANNFHVWVSPITTSSLLSAARDNNVPVYLRVHNYFLTGSLDLLKSRVWKKYLCVSKSVAEQITSKGVDKKRIEIIYPPIDTSRFFPKKDSSIRRRFSIPENSVLIMHASRITGSPTTFEEKGIPSLLRVFSKVDSNSHLLICAAGTTQEKKKEFDFALSRIEDIAGKLKISDRIHVLSAEFREMPKVYNNADIFTMLSKIETFGNVYAEAMACKIPAIGTRVGGIPEVIKDKTTGFLVGSDKEACEKLNLLIKDKQLREKIGEKARKHVEDNFDIAIVQKKLIEAINN